MIVTFYSYKGGTGRTMALANIATLLAERGRRVLAVDFDLEAPGLWRYFSRFQEQLDQQPGLIDLLVTSSSAADALDVDWRDYVTHVPLQSSGLSLMTSGQFGERYASRVLNFDWTKFFQNSRGGEFFERLRRQWREEYDFILIDSRTGVTDSGGICTIMLPDLIIPVFVSNHQSLEGAVEVIARAQVRRKTLAYDRPPAAILPILSRFDSRTEYESAQEWLDIAADSVKQFYSDWLPSAFSPRRALERTKLPYVAYFSFGETLPVLTEGVSDPESLGYALNTVSQLIEQEMGNAELIMGSGSERALEAPTQDALPDAVNASAAAETAIRLFLSYSEEDREIGSQIASWLSENGFEVFDPASTRQTETALQKADAFLALVSPSYLASYWCRREQELAIQAELDLQQADKSKRTFIYVLRIQDTPGTHLGFLSTYDWTDLTNPAVRETALRRLAGSLRSVSEPGVSSPGSVGFQRPSAAFRDREAELEVVLRGLTNPAGPHFWLVVGPPQMGKSWFLDRIAADPALSGRWVIKPVDLRTESPDLRQNPHTLLARFFDRPSAVSGPEDLLAIAQEIAKSGMPHLCLLDSAELLDANAAVTLRADLGQIYHLVQDTARKGVRLALIVASRQEGGWLGIASRPRFSPLPLTEFNVAVVEQALRDLAQETERYFGLAELRRVAALAYRLIEGLPALLVRCLDWIQAQQWVGIDRLDGQQMFDQLAGAYIENTLFAQRSLLPEVQEPADDALHALQQAFRVLSPHRLFTWSHLRHYIEEDPNLNAALFRADWSIDDLWEAISRTSLLKRPQNEPWQEIHPAIRRLLYRYYYRSDTQRLAAHSGALSFVKVLTNGQIGTEQVVGLVESLWHEAIVLSIRHPAEMKQDLSKSADLLSRALKGTPAFTVEELQGYAAERITNDREFQEAFGNVDGLLSRLVESLTTPLPQP